MLVLNFKSVSCKNCYKCLRNCPVKAISFNDTNAQIINDKCILCGHCVSVCPQNAKWVRNDIHIVKDLLSSGKKVVASIAPAYVSSFKDVSKEVLFTAISKLGFSFVSETAVGAEYVTNKYAELLQKGEYKNFITSACPAVVRMVQYKYYDALPYLAPIESPMVAHSKLIKEQFGEDTSVVFISPCIAKKREAEESGSVDAALTFEELKDWFLEKQIDYTSVTPDKSIYEDFNGKALFYPINRGIIKSFYEYNDKYDYVYVDGVSRCEEVLSNIENLSGMVIEMSACENSCVSGPCSIKHEGGFIKATEQVRVYAKKNSGNKYTLNSNKDIKKPMRAYREYKKLPTEHEISVILQKIGKESVADELNCGACGYNTCRDKAAAVFNGVASLEMCLPYMRDRAESITEEIFKNAPYGVIVVNNELIIHDINDEARAIYGIKEYSLKGTNLIEHINPTDFLLAQVGGEKIINKKIHIDSTDKWVLMSIYRVEKHELLLCTLIDITKDVQMEHSMHKVKLEMAETTRKVIEKQMNIVQEIASLLGETTADTKVALTKLKNVVMKEYEE